MKNASGWFACAALILGVGRTAPARADLVYVTDFTKTANMQANIEPSYPSGIFAPNNGFGTSFDITSDANGHNYGELRGSDGQLFSPGTYTVDIGIFGVTDVYTLMNAYAPQPRQVLASVEFIGSEGATETFQLVNGINVRDEFMGAYANTINGTTTRNAFTVTGQGAAGTGSDQTGAYGTYVIDEQRFVLPSEFATQTLEQIIYTYTGASGTGILEALSVVTSVPEPSSVILLGAGMAMASACLTRCRRR
jgi:PEP-CTERM motif